VIGEAELDGVFIPYLLILTMSAFVFLLPIRWVLRRTHLYRFVWHAGLFDVALFVVILWILARATVRIGPVGLGL
jgi:uncharacterized protein DUF1656